jgi:acid-sensing ion channel, other
LDFEPEENFLYLNNGKEMSEKPPWHIMSKNEYLFVKVWPSEDLQSVTAQIGFICFIHRPNELPSDASAHFYHDYNYTDVVIYPQQTLISDEVRQMSIQRRNCYLEHEKSLELFQVYSKQNCEHECQSSAFARRCGCVPFYLLSKLQIETFLCRNSFSFFAGKSDEKICDVLNRNCTEATRRILDSEVAKCNCLESCDELSYEVLLQQYPE